MSLANVVRVVGPDQRQRSGHSGTYRHVVITEGPVCSEQRVAASACARCGAMSTLLGSALNLGICLNVALGSVHPRTSFLQLARRLDARAAVCPRTVELGIPLKRGQNIKRINTSLSVQSSSRPLRRPRLPLSLSRPRAHRVLRVRPRRSMEGTFRRRRRSSAAKST